MWLDSIYMIFPKSTAIRMENRSMVPRGLGENVTRKHTVGELLE